MIRVYPSALEGEPLESHVIPKPVFLVDWLRRKAPEFSLEREQPIFITVDGETLPVEAWSSYVVQPDTDLRIYPEARAAGAAVAAWVAVAIAAVAVIMVMTMKTPGASQPGQGDTIDLNPAKANTAKVNEPVREILGRYKVYPDYVVQPVSRFVNQRELHTSLCLCVGAGSHAILPSSIKIGDTPLAAFGTDVSYAIYGPGESLAGDVRAENWYSVGEVGGTDAGTSGLDTASTATGGTSVIADALVLGGLSVSLAGESPAFPEEWGPGLTIAMRTPNSYTVTSVGEYDRISGALGDLAPFVGMKVTLSTDVDYDLVVAGYSPYVPPVPGTGGSPSSVQASASPTSYDFSSSPVVWTITYRGNTRSVSLASNYMNMSGLVAAVTSQLEGMGLTAQDNSGRLLIAEPSSPYRGGTLSQSNAPVAVFGIAPVYTVGSASAGGVPERQAYIELNYDNGTPFAGLEDGTQRLSIGYRGHRYNITGIDGLTMTVQRLKDNGDVDTNWDGFSVRTLLDFSLGADGAASLNWLGPFMAVPEQELTDTVEYDFHLPGGLAWYKSNGHRRGSSVSIVVEWRDAAIGGPWTRETHPLQANTEDSIGFTFRRTLPYRMRPQFRLRRELPESGGNTRDTVYWYGLRSRLEAPAAYEGVTIFTATIRTGDRLGAQSDRRVSLVAERLYENATGRSISGAAQHVLGSLGIPADEVDTPKLSELESSHWTPRGETFDLEYTESSSVREVLQTIFAAGMSHLTLTDGLISAIREGVQPVRGTITNHELEEELTSTFTAPGQDDFDGVDVKYVDSHTWSEETVPCRLGDSLGLKIDSITVDGVVDRDRAWRIGMRALRKHQSQRWSYSGTTDLEALCYERFDRIALADDIPGTSQSALIVGASVVADRVVLELTEPLDWNVANPRVLIRRHDGSATPLLVPVRVGEYHLSVAAMDLDFDLVTDLSIEPARLLFAESTQMGYSAMMSEINPGSDGSCDFTALEYRDDYYADDDGFAPT